MSSISVQPTSGLTVASPVKAGAGAAAYASTNETAKSQSTAQSSTTQTNGTTPYPSPVGSIDPTTGQFVLEFRDGASGEVNYQTPSKVQLRLYQENQTRVEIAGQTPVSAVPDEDTVSAVA